MSLKMCKGLTNLNRPLQTSTEGTSLEVCTGLKRFAALEHEILLKFAFH